MIPTAFIGHRLRFVMKDLHALITAIIVIVIIEKTNLSTVIIRNSKKISVLMMPRIILLFINRNLFILNLIDKRETIVLVIYMKIVVNFYIVNKLACIFL